MVEGDLNTRIRAELVRTVAAIAQDSQPANGPLAEPGS